jgi:hypothetical protein
MYLYKHFYGKFEMNVPSTKLKSPSFKKSVYPTAPKCIAPEKVKPSIEASKSSNRRYPTEALKASAGLTRDNKGRFLPRGQGECSSNQSTTQEYSYPCGHAGQRSI